ncbi:MAG: DNA-processing protein DprA [Oscillospiraceae bacterium]|jgi:DNA processing protein|nr:DNA-processing protein DprA [Oscillospiraceae bacterium]
MKYTSEQYFRMWLAGIENVGPTAYNRLLAKYGSAETVWRCFDDSLAWVGKAAYEAIKGARDKDKALRQMELLDKIGARAVFDDDPLYPPLLKCVDNRPPILYVLGNDNLDTDMCVAIVGTRNPTQYGLQAAELVARDLTSLGFTIVSGFALGIDSAAHKGCLDAGGHTVAVFACGVDYIYPPKNKDFCKRLLDNGGTVISEYPPGVMPLPGRFPARNRIISGMSRGTLVVQGAWKSGARVTADIAGEQGREIFVLPGSIFEAKSELPNGLARDGARIITSAYDIAQDLGFEVKLAEEPEAAEETKPKTRSKKRSSDEKPQQVLVAPVQVKPQEPPNLSESERKVYELYVGGTTDVDRIVISCGISASEVNSILTTLQLEGII